MWENISTRCNSLLRIQIACSFEKRTKNECTVNNNLLMCYQSYNRLTQLTVPTDYSVEFRFM